MKTMLEHPPKVLWSLPRDLAEQDCACADLLPDLSWSQLSELTETDCACADHASPAISPILEASGVCVWQQAPALYRAALPQSHELAFNPLGPVGVVVLNRLASAVLDRYQQPQPLTDAWSRQLAALQLLTPATGMQPAARQAASTLTAWLHVTNACNLRCTYCYLNKTPEMMSDDTGRAAVDAIFRSATLNGFHTVKLKYAGGEATLNFQLIQALHAYARQQAARLGLGLREVILSNGVALTTALLDWLQTESVALMISLDGVGKVHDAQRAFHNGRGSFERVANGLDCALKRGVRPHLSITVTAHNADRLAEAVAFALERDLPFNLNFFRNNDCTTTTLDLTAGNERLVSGVQAALAVIEAQLPYRRLIDALIDRSAFDAPHHYACGAGHSYLVIDHYGRTARCQMEIERSVGDVLAEDPLALVRAPSRDFMSLPVDQKSECRECMWRYWCAGGCPLLTKRATGRYDVKSPYCNVYRALYPEVLRLEALRLLKWQT